MKLIWLFSFLISFCPSANAASAFVKSTQLIGTGSSATTLVSAAQNHAAGNLLVVFISYDDAGNAITISSIANTAGDTCTAGTRKNASSTTSIMYYCANTAGNAANVFTVTLNTTTDFRCMIVAEFSGVTTTTPLDVEATPANATNATITSSAFTTANNNEMVVLGGTGVTTFTAGLIGGSTGAIGASGNYMALEYRHTSATIVSGTAAMTQGSSGAFNAHVMTFKDTGAAPTTDTLTGPTSGATNAASTNFTITLDNPATGTITFTPACTVGSVTYSPSSPQITIGNSTVTYTATPTSDGTHVCTVTNSGGLSDVGSVSYVTTTTKYTRVNYTGLIKGANIMVLVPNINAAIPYNSSNPTPVVIYCMGHGEDETALLSDSLKTTTRDAMLDAGYILVGTAVGTASWGNQASVEPYADVDYIVRLNYNVSQVVLWGQSMGGLDALLVLSQQKVRGIVGLLFTYGAANLSSIYNSPPASGGAFPAEINTAYSITGSGGHVYAAQTYGNDPMLLDPISFRGISIRAYASASDVTVDKAANTTALKTRINSSVKSFVVVDTTGVHGDPSNFVPADYVAFVATAIAAAPATTGIIGGSGSSSPCFFRVK